MADRCLYGVPARDGEAWWCSLSEIHDGDHYLVRAAGGRVTPIPPDSERDARRARYSQRERQRAAVALDAWFRVALMIKLSVWDIVNGAGVVEEIARFVLDAAGDDLWEAHDAVMKLQQKSHYGATEHAPGSHFGGCPDRDWTGEPYLSCEGVPADPDGVSYPQHCDGETLMAGESSLFVCGRLEVYGRHNPHAYGVSGSR